MAWNNSLTTTQKNGTQLHVNNACQLNKWGCVEFDAGLLLIVQDDRDLVPQKTFSLTTARSSCGTHGGTWFFDDLL